MQVDIGQVGNARPLGKLSVIHALCSSMLRLSGVNEDVCHFHTSPPCRAQFMRRLHVILIPPKFISGSSSHGDYR